MKTLLPKLSVLAAALSLAACAAPRVLPVDVQQTAQQTEDTVKTTLDDTTRTVAQTADGAQQSVAAASREARRQSEAVSAARAASARGLPSGGNAPVSAGTLSAPPLPSLLGR